VAIEAEPPPNRDWLVDQMPLIELQPSDNNENQLFALVFTWSLGAKVDTFTSAGQYIVDGGCVRSVCFELTHLHDVRIPKPSEVAVYQDASGKRQQVTLIGRLEISIETGHYEHTMRLPGTRYVPGFNVNLIAEKDLVERFSIGDISYSRGTLSKQLLLRDGATCTLRHEHGLHWLPLAHTSTAATAQQLPYTVKPEPPPPIQPPELAAPTDYTVDVLEPASNHSEHGSLRMRRLHLQLGHAGPIEMEGACRRYGMRLTKADRHWLDNFRHIHCPGCAVAKHRRIKVPRLSRSDRVTRVGEKVACDVLGKFAQECVGGMNYAWGFVDFYSRMVFFY
jgi:hypothetical protein